MPRNRDAPMRIGSLVRRIRHRFACDPIKPSLIDLEQPAGPANRLRITGLADHHP
jgi:hypothetical protein